MALVIAVICLVIAAIVCAGNIGFAAARMKRSPGDGSRQASFILLLSAVFCLMAWAMGRQFLGFWAFAPAVLDPGNWLLPILLFRR